MSNFSEILREARSYLSTGLTVLQIENSTAAELVGLLEVKPDDVTQFTNRIGGVKKSLIGYAKQRDDILMVDEIQNALTNDQRQWLIDNIEFFNDRIVEQNAEVLDG